MMGFMTTKLLSQQEINTLSKHFQSLDKDGEGFISFEDLWEVLYSMKGIDLNEEELRAIIEKVDADNNGKINYTEFLMVSMNQEQLLSNDRLEAAFKMFDKNGDNEVSVDEIKSMLESVKTVDEKMILRAMNEVDRKGKTALKFQEFKIMMERLFQ